MKIRYYYDKFDNSIKTIEDFHDQYCQLVNSGFFPNGDNTTLQDWINGYILHQDILDVTDYIYSLKTLGCSSCNHFNKGFKICENRKLIKILVETPEHLHFKYIDGEYCFGYNSKII